MQITRTGFKADRYIEKVGGEHQGCYRAFDHKTGKSGYVNPNGYFIADADKSIADDSGSFNVENVSKPIIRGSGGDDNLILENAKDLLNGTLATFAFLVGAVAMGTYARELLKNPSDKEGAKRKAGKNAACALGIIGVFVALLIFTIVIIFMGGIFGTYTSLVYDIVFLICGYTVFGLIRIMRGKSFFINISQTVQKIGEIHVPRIVYVCIMILSVVLLFQPVINLLDALTMDWFEANKASFTEIQVIGMVVGMAGISVLVGVLVGVVVCAIIKKITLKA